MGKTPELLPEAFQSLWNLTQAIGDLSRRLEAPCRTQLERAAQLEQMEWDLHSAQERVRVLEAELQNQKREEQELLGHVWHLEQRHNQLTEKSERAERAATEERKAAFEIASELDRFRTALTASEKERAELTQNLSRFQSEVSNLLSHDGQMRGIIVQLQAQIRQLQTEATEVQSRCESLDEENFSLQQKAAVLQRELQGFKDANIKLRNLLSGENLPSVSLEKPTVGIDI